MNSVPQKKRIALLGATGSIGKSSLDIISRNKNDFDVVLLAARSNGEKLAEISKQFPGVKTILTGVNGADGKLLDAIAEIKPDITINGISGAAGLKPSLAAINAGSHVALANKETIVMAGHLVMRLAKEKNVNIIPVDSEHSAIFHLTNAHAEKNSGVERGLAQASGSLINEIILTASGGAFRNLSLKEMEEATVNDALAHPTWNMGPKITIDSASMANKGLEIIEACVLFNMPQEKVKVVIHPQSIVHSMIRLCSGVVYAQLSKPDMRHPIHDALNWPDTAPSALDVLNFDSLILEFYKPDPDRFPMLTYAWEAAKQGGLYPCAYNAANETAVAAFLEHKIRFLDIPRITEHVLKADWSAGCSNLETVLQADSEARSRAALYIHS